MSWSLELEQDFSHPCSLHGYCPKSNTESHPSDHEWDASNSKTYIEGANPFEP